LDLLNVGEKRLSVPEYRTCTRDTAVVVGYNDYVPKSEPVTVRLAAELDRWVSAEAKRTHRPKGTIVASLAQEALKSRLFPGIAFRGDDWDRRAWVLGTSFDVWEVVRSFQDARSVQAVASGGSLTEAQVRVALAYYRRFGEEVDPLVERDRRGLDELMADYPTIEVLQA
jgi:uncharacterized protein (DUF433 family)